MRSKHQWAKVIGLWLILSLAIGCASGSGGQSPATEGKKADQPLKKIKIGTTPSLSFFASRLALDKGLFKEEGLEVELVQSTASVAIQSLVAGDLDYTEFIGSSVRAAAKGVPIKAFMGIYVKPIHSLMAKKDIKSAADLKGKTIGQSNVGATDEVVMRLLVAHLGLDPQKDVKVLNVGAPPQRKASLEQGMIDGTAIDPPLNFVLEKQGYTVLADATKVLDLPLSGLVASDKKLAGDPDEVKRVIRAFLKAVKYIKTNREDTIKFIMGWLKLERDIAEKSYERVVAAFTSDGMIPENAMKLQLKIDKQELKAEQDIPPEKVSDFRLLREVLKEQGR